MGRRFEFLTAMEACRAFDDSWDSLASRNPKSKPFQSSWWCKSWCQHVAGEVDCTPVIARATRGRLQVACALAIRDEGGHTVANALGVDWADYYDAIGPDCPEAIALLAELLEDITHRHTLDLTDVVPGGLLSRAANLLNVETEKSTPCYIVDITDKDRVKHITSRRSHAIRRRRLERIGDLRVVNYTNWKEIRDHLPQLITMHRSQWDSNPDTFASFYDSATEKMFYSMAESGSATNQVVLSSLRLDDCPLAMYFGFRTDDWYGAYRIAYDISYKKFSPGNLLLSKMIYDFSESGYKEFDLMRGAHPYKLEYASKIRWNHRITI